MVGLGVLIVGALTLREGADEEVRVVTTGALLLGRHPVRPRPQQIGAQHKFLTAQKIGEGQASVLQCGTGLVVHRGVADNPVGVIGRAGEQHSGFLEGLPGGRAHQGLGQVGLDAETLCPPGGFGSVPGPDTGQSGVPVAFVHAAAGKHRHTGGELHRRMATHQEHLEPGGSGW